jgi:hypothetical protein
VQPADSPAPLVLRREGWSLLLADVVMLQATVIFSSK